MSSRLHPMCRRCGWAMGGVDSWNGRACKCGHTAPPFPDRDDVEAADWRSIIEAPIAAVIARALRAKRVGPSSQT